MDAIEEKLLPGERGYTPPKDASPKRTRVNLDVLGTNGLLHPDAMEGRLAEEYRYIKRPLLMNARRAGEKNLENRNLIMVTSAVPGEGKTYTAFNLALSIAKELDSTVLLIDADLRMLTLTRALGTEKEKGMIDILTEDDTDLGDVLIKTSVPKLALLPAGQSHSHATELLASEHMRKFAQEISQRYNDRIVIFDAPPLLATTEAAVLSDLVGQIVFVVEAETTQQAVVMDALSRLETSKFVGLVLNKQRISKKSDYYYGYGD